MIKHYHIPTLPNVVISDMNDNVESELKNITTNDSVVQVITESSTREDYRILSSDGDSGTYIRYCAEMTDDSLTLIVSSGTFFVSGPNNIYNYKSQKRLSVYYTLDSKNKKLIENLGYSHANINLSGTVFMTIRDLSSVVEKFNYITREVFRFYLKGY